jgi:hypothetical protein
MWRKRFGAMAFGERRRGNFRQAHLFVGDPVRIFLERGERRLDAGILRDAFDGHGVFGSRGHGGHSDQDTGDAQKLQRFSSRGPVRTPASVGRLWSVILG